GRREDRLPVGKRQGLPLAAAGSRSEAVGKPHREPRDAPARSPAGSCAARARRASVSALAHNALLVLEDDIDSGPIEQALPPGSRVTKTALPDAAYLWSSLTATAADVDLVVFACD